MKAFQFAGGRLVGPGLAIFAGRGSNEFLDLAQQIRRQTSDMMRAAIGVRMHSGWGALVAVSNGDGGVEIVERRRITVTAPGERGAVQPYHYAKNLELAEAEKFIGDCFAASKRLALAAVEEVVGELRERKYRVVGCAVVLASGRPLPPLAKILGAHPLIHTAEGSFFREVFSKACKELGLTVGGFRERDLDECVQATFGKTSGRIRRQISTLGRSVGPPWTTDQKTAALAAMLVLGNKQR